MKKMKHPIAAHPFAFDPFKNVLQAFYNLYGVREMIVQWDPGLTEGYGETCFGEHNRIVVSISPELPVKHAIEILAHELAHVAARAENEHNEKWQGANDAIHEEYLRIVGMEEERREQE